MKVDLDKKISVYMFVIIVLVFVLLFCWMCSSQMKFTVNKILENQRLEKPITPSYTPSTYTPATQKEIEKYQY